MIYVADTNIVSEIMKLRIDSNVLSWFWDHEGEIYLTSITVQELYYGVLRMSDGKRKKKLKKTIDAIVRDCADETFPMTDLVRSIALNSMPRRLRQDLLQV